MQSMKVYCLYRRSQRCDRKVYGKMGGRRRQKAKEEHDIDSANMQISRKRGDQQDVSERQTVLIAMEYNGEARQWWRCGSLAARNKIADDGGWSRGRLFGSPRARGAKQTAEESADESGGSLVAICGSERRGNLEFGSRTM